MIASIRRLFGSPAKSRPPISSPMRLATGVTRVQSLGSGARISASAQAITQQDPRHAEALKRLSLDTLDNFRRDPRLAKLDPKKVHLMHVTFARGTSSSVLRDKLPIGVRGTQLGLAAGVRSRAGGLHGYALVYIA